MLATADIFLLEDFRLDRQGDGLSRCNERGVFVPVPIGLRALDVLSVLVERSGALVSKEEIMAAVWGRTVVENSTECRDLHGQIGSLNDRPPPNRRHDLLFRDETTVPLDKHTENIESSWADRYRNENAAVIAPRQTLIPAIEAKFLEQKNVGRGEHALSPFSSRGHRILSEACASPPRF